MSANEAPKAGRRDGSDWLGGALSIAILGSIGTAVYRGQMADGVPVGVPSEEAETARDTLGGAVAAADELNPALAAELLDVAREAFTKGMQVAALTSVVVAAVLLRRLRTGSEDEREVDLEPDGASVRAAAELE